MLASTLPQTGNIKFPQYTLDSLKLVGIIMQNKQRWALIKSPETVLVASIDTIISKTAARIIEINRTNIHLQTAISSSKNHITILKLRN